MARWQSGYAADCNSVYAGSIPTLASISQSNARVAELVDAADLKSVSRNRVRVQVPPWAPSKLVIAALFGQKQPLAAIVLTGCC
jgi:hypothetical protein